MYSCGRLGYDGSVEIAFNTSLLVVIDVQAGFLNAETRQVIGPVRNLARAWVAESLPLVLGRYHNFPGSPFERLLHWYKLRGDEETMLAGELDEFVREATIIDKVGYTVFTADLDKLCAKLEITDVVLCGLDSETCVLKSAADAFERGLTPWIAADACASNGGVVWHERAMELAGRYVGPGQIVTTDEIVARLT